MVETIFGGRLRLYRIGVVTVGPGVVGRVPVFLRSGFRFDFEIRSPGEKNQDSRIRSNVVCNHVDVALVFRRFEFLDRGGGEWLYITTVDERSGVLPCVEPGGRQKGDPVFRAGSDEAPGTFCRRKRLRAGKN